MLNENPPPASPNGIKMEVLQPEISHEIRQATLEELKKWIQEGKLLPNHQVRIKNLSWIKAIQVQSLKSAFESAEQVVIEQSKQPEKVMPVSVEPIVKPVIEKKTTPSDSSIPFKLYEEKMLGKSKSNDVKADDSIKVEPRVTDLKTNQPEKKEAKAHQFKTKSSPKYSKKTNSISRLQTLGVVLVGCLFSLILSYGGSYVWIYSLRGTPKIDEKKIGELAVLEQKNYNEKVNLRLAAGGTDQQIDLNVEFAKMDKKLEEQRKPIIENYKQNLLQHDFNNLFYFSACICLVVFLIFRLFSGNRHQKTISNNEFFSLQTPELHKQEIEETKSETLEKELHETEISQIQTTHSPDVHQTNPSTQVANLNDLISNPEYKNLLEAENIKFCLLHREKPSEFVCEGCNNDFCADCLTTNETQENCCPFCRITCKPVESVKTKVIIVNVAGDGKQTKKTIKPINLVVKVNEEKRTYKVGVFTALLISMCFSASLSYFWVYEISSRLEPQVEEVTQNVSPEQPQQKQEKKVAYDVQPQLDKSGVPVPRKCVDPESREIFECDEETYRALFDHTAKTESVEAAQKQVEEKTKLILNPLLPEDEKDKEQDNVKQASPEQQAKIENDRSKFIQLWLISFVLMFGGLLSARFFFKDGNEPQDENEETFEQ